MQNDRFYPYILTATILVSFFLCLNLVPLFDFDEGAFCEATREMLKSGNYLTTYLNGALRFEKPILIYWLQALSVKVLGLNEFALRLPSALASTMWAILIYLFTRSVMDKNRAFWASFLMVTSLQIALIAKAAIADALLNVCIAATMFAIFKYFEKGERRYLYATYFFMAMGTLAKGPVAVLIPFGVSIIFFWLQKDIRRWFIGALDIKGIGLFLIIAMPWYVLEYIDQGMPFIKGFFFKNNIGRFKTPLQGHSGSLIYYIPVVILGLLPFTSLFFSKFRSIKTDMKTPLFQFLWIWFFFVFLFFSFSGTKLPHYVIYGYTPLFILMAGEIENIQRGYLIILPFLFLCVILLFIPNIALAILPRIKDDFARVMIESGLGVFDLEYKLFLSGIIILLLILSFMRVHNRARVIFMGLCMVVMFNFVVMRKIAETKQAPVKKAAFLARARGYDVVMWKLHAPSFIFYLGKLVKKRQPRTGDVVFTKVTYLKEIGDFQVFYKKNGYVLVRIIKQ